MLNRRLIRIKVFKTLFCAVSAGTDSLKSIQSSFMTSCDKTRDLYFFMINLAVALKRASDQKIEKGLMKFQPTPEELNPNTKFSENQLVKMVLEEERFISYVERQGLTWDSDELKLYVKRLFATISERDYFKKYMNSPERSLKEDCKLFIEIYRRELENDKVLDGILEDMSIYWTDDLGFVLNSIISNLEYMARKEVFPIPSTFLKDDDKEFAIELMDFSVLNYNKYYKVVESYLSNWESDRLVNTDIVLIVLGIAEAVRFSNIPMKVTLNEYVEISKYYSTEHSNLFVNGILDKIIKDMMNSGEIVKSGRGLVDA